jgi:DNA-nicking Smr family endonuclease
MTQRSADDAGLWRRAMRDVAPLRGRAAPPEKPPPLGPQLDPAGADSGGAAEGRTRAAPSRPSPTRTEPPPPLDRFAGIDRASAERLKRGRYPVEARLDLHGMTQAEAHRALDGFLSRSRAVGRRCVLVITGHGRASGGVLKAAVPRWLGEPDLRRHLLAVNPAQPRDGGSAALYLLLRKASWCDAAGISRRQPTFGS